MTTRKKNEKAVRRLGKQPPCYRFFLNPYQYERFSKCPQCSNKMGQRKLPLFIHIDPNQPFILNKTCRYCSHCDLLIVHRDKLNQLIMGVFPALDPETINSQYLVIGTVDRPAWKRVNDPDFSTQEIIEALHDFKDVVTFTRGGGWEDALRSR